MTGNKKQTVTVVLTPAQVQAKKAKAKARREKQKAKKQAQKASGMALTSAPVSIGAKVKGQSGKSIREQGTDQMVSAVVSTSIGKAIITQQVIVPALFPRLSQLAKSFQRIKYHRLRFEIVTGTSTSTGGVYVAGFVADATDPIDATTVTSTLLASGGSSTKYWQSTEVVVNKFPPELFYTNPHEGEQRWSSPGSLVIASISSPTQSVTFEVFCHWDVSLSKPTYESTTKTDQVVSKCLHNVYSSNGNKYLSKRNGTSWTPLLYSDFDPPLQGNVYYVLGGWRTASVQGSDGTLTGNFGFFALSARAVGQTYVIYPVDDQSSVSTQNFHGEEYVIRKGELVFQVLSLSLSKDPWYHSHPNLSHSWLSKSMSSRFPWTSPEYWEVDAKTPENCSTEPCGGSEPISESTSGPPSCARSSEFSKASRTTLKELLAEAILSPLQESLMDSLRSLKVTSSTEHPSPPSSDRETPEELGFEAV